MSPDSLVIENAGKVYREYASEIQRFARWFGARIDPLSERWVLRHISFKVAAGEAVGVIGQNGAGKSTLLKMIAGTTLPNEGRVSTNGRVSALLELGLGFNPELTGRENARHAAGLMGVGGEEIDRLIPEIEAFAEIGDYFDQSMRTYSSGMQMRVAFSVATAIRPDVLIVDEALAVGDAYFVHKCFQRIQQFRDTGTTLLIVSHDPTVVQALCDRAILLDKGRLMLDGLPQEVFDYYNALIAEKENSGVRTKEADGSVGTESGSGEAVFEQLDILDAQGQPVEYVEVGRPVSLRAKVRAISPVDRLVFGYMIRDRLGQPIYGTNTHHTGQALEDVEEGEAIEFNVCFPANLGTGSYSVSVALSSTETHLVRNYQWKDLALVFTVANVDHPVFVGLAHIPARIEITRQATGRLTGSA
ncbi:ABC transporter ATP-binding protein [Cognatiluteimonas weifangensis]|uniref:ABC transporter ATP-binding protein n=1 Tax=Cognatiluteimonas weifangensis TaxID=2303539 RepID=A0A372DLU4_9GAMM|nr:ABC transporter ATP-binding protein [Luteimonas weifangensis]RFP60565.1 ABC transporter ATP-binding protein [Luteimonas weifangensis]